MTIPLFNMSLEDKANFGLTIKIEAHKRVNVLK
jgi:hypothetical protein